MRSSVQTRVRDLACRCARELARRTGARILGALLVAGLAACSSDAGTEPGEEPLARLAGTWEGTEMVVASQDADPGTRIDILGGGFGDASFTLEIEETGRYTATLVVPGLSDEEETGAIELTESSITLDPDGEDPPTTGTWSLEGGVLEIDGETEFNFGGGLEPADLHLELERA